MADITQTDINKSSAAVPALTAPSPNPLPNPAPPDINAPTPQTPAIPAAPAPTQPPAPAPNTNMDANTHHSMIGKAFQTIAGGQTTDYVQGPQGQPIPIKRDLKPGELARNILGSALAMISAGAGGALAAKEKRPFELGPGQSVGAVINGPVQQREQQAQKVFQNQQTADEATLRAHRDAMEQQESIQKAVAAEDAHQEHVQQLAVGNRESDEAAYNDLVKTQKDYQTALAMPGAQVMQDALHEDLNFLTPREAQDYAIKHPEIMHGSTNGNTKFGTIIQKNPVTGSYQIIDYPADRHETGLANFGQKKDKNGDPVFAADGSPVPDGTVLDPKTKKPTVLTQTVTPQQAQDIQKNNLTQANIQAEMDDREAQSRQRDAEAKKNQELSDASDIFNSGQIDKMTDRQKQIMSRFILPQETLLARRDQQAQANLVKANANGTEQEIAAAQKEANDAKSDYDEIHDKYNQLTGITPGIQAANEILRQGFAGTPAVKDDKGNITTPAIPWAWNGPGGKYEEIGNSGLPETEIVKARTNVYNALSPAQKQSWVDDKGNFSATTPGQPTTPTAPKYKEGDTVVIKGGKTVTITKINPDGSFDYDHTK